jgi:peptidyl-prolyl cis-trans isomerase SurA
MRSHTDIYLFSRKPYYKFQDTIMIRFFSLHSVRPANIFHCLIFFSLLILPASRLHAELVDRVLAVVNDEIITLSELDKEGQSIFRKIAATTPAAQLEEALADARAEILETLIDKRLISQKAAAQKITVSDDEINAALDNVLKRTRMTKEQLIEKLKESGVNEDIYKSTLKSQLLQNKLVGSDVQSKIVVTEQMVRNHYDTNYTSRIEEGAYYLLQMGFSWEDPQGRDLSQAALYANKSDAQKRAERVHSLATSGQDFGTLARKFSDLPSKEDGGDIGSFELDDMAEYMQQAVKGLQPGDISAVIETPIGFQFFKLLSAGDDSVVKTSSYDTVKEEIKQELLDKELQEAYAQWVKELKEQAYIQKL